MHLKIRSKALELYNTFRSAISKTGNPNNVHDHIKECAKASCDKVLIELTKDKERSEFYRAVRLEIDKL